MDLQVLSSLTRLIIQSKQKLKGLLTSGGGGGPSSKILLRIGIKKAAVFPDPKNQTSMTVTLQK